MKTQPSYKSLLFIISVAACGILYGCGENKGSAVQPSAAPPVAILQVPVVKDNHTSDSETQKPDTDIKPSIIKTEPLVTLSHHTSPLADTVSSQDNMTAGVSLPLDRIKNDDPVLERLTSISSTPEDSTANIDKPENINPSIIPEKNTLPAKGKKILVFGDYNSSKIADYLKAKGIQADNISAKPDSFDPEISGDYLVWADSRNGNWDIYAYCISKRSAFIVTNNTAYQYYPKISGDYIVWQDFRNGNWDLYAYKISTGVEFPVTTAPGNQYNFQVKEDYIVWEDLKNGNRDIYAYHISTGEEFPVTTALNDQIDPKIDGDYIVWSDFRNGNYDIYAYQISQGIEFPVTTALINQIKPEIADGYIVWNEWEGGSYNIYAYQISTDAEFSVTTALNDQIDPKISGDYIVWSDFRNGNYDIYAYQISTGIELSITSAMDDQIKPEISGDYILWNGWENGGYNIYVYQISTGAEHMIGSLENSKAIPKISGSNIIWSDDKNGFYHDIFISSDLGNTITNITSDKLDSIDNYAAIIFGDDLDGDNLDMALSLFDIADEARVNILAIGTSFPLGTLLEKEGRFDLLTNSSYGHSPMKIELTSSGNNHPIFYGIGNSILLLENQTAFTRDETTYYTDPQNGTTPNDWTVLAKAGLDMGLAGYPMIVSFTTENGTEIIMDGSANSADNYAHWTETRWELLYNEVIYLARGM